MGNPPRAPVHPRPPGLPSHENFLRKPEAVGRLIKGNVFPSACFVGKQSRWSQGSVLRETEQVPWRMIQAREARGVQTPIDRTHYHQPNEFGAEVAAAARMGLKLFGGR